MKEWAADASKIEKLWSRRLIEFTKLWRQANLRGVNAKFEFFQIRPAQANLLWPLLNPNSMRLGKARRFPISGLKPTQGGSMPKFETKNCEPKTANQKLRAKNCKPKLRTKNCKPKTASQKLQAKNCEPKKCKDGAYSKLRIFLN